MRPYSILTVVAAALLAASCASSPAARTPEPASAPAPAVSKTAAKPAPVFPVSVKTFSRSGGLVSVKTGTATETGWRLVETGPTGKVVFIDDFVLGPRRELVSLTRRNGGGRALAVAEYQYDASGRLSALVSKAGDGRLKTRTVYTYDARGNNTKIEIYDAGGTLNTVYERQFENGRLVLEKGYAADGAVVEVVKTTWKDGRKAAQETVSPLARTLEYSYGGGDVPTGLVRSVRGQVVERQTFEYQ